MRAQFFTRFSSGDAPSTAQVASEYDREFLSRDLTAARSNDECVTLHSGLGNWFGNILLENKNVVESAALRGYF